MPSESNDAIAWIRANLELRATDSAQALYDHMASQSGGQLPIIYQPFDPNRRGHFVDRAQILDYAIVAGPGRVLDFGPGDGWPALLMGPFVGEVVGVDGSRRRVDVCRANAARLDCANATFVHVPPGAPLPFPDESFDGATAASSIEQTPDPQATLRELYRVLRPGGRLRIDYESLSYYRNGREREVKFGLRTLVFDRYPEEEHVDHYLIVFDAQAQVFQAVESELGGRPKYEHFTTEVLESLRRSVLEAYTWTTQHPSCATLLRGLREVGFSKAVATQDGGAFARRLFDRLPETGRPQRLEEVDTLLRPLVEVVVELEAVPAPRADGWEPMITATK